MPTLLAVHREQVCSRLRKWPSLLVVFFWKVDSPLPGRLALPSPGMMVRGELLREPFHHTAGQAVDELDLSCSRAFSLFGVFRFIAFGEFKLDRLKDCQPAKCLVADIDGVKINVLPALV